MVFGDNAFLLRRVVEADVPDGDELRRADQHDERPLPGALRDAALQPHATGRTPATAACPAGSDTSGMLLVNGVWQSYRDPDSPGLDTHPWWAEYRVDFDDDDLSRQFHSFDVQLSVDDPLNVNAKGAGSFGNDYLAGSQAHDLIFGQMGNDVIQGDGGIEQRVRGPVARRRLALARRLRRRPAAASSATTSATSTSSRRSRPWPAPTARTTSRAAAAATSSSAASARTTSSAAAPTSSASRTRRSASSARPSRSPAVARRLADHGRGRRHAHARSATRCPAVQSTTDGRRSSARTGGATGTVTLTSAPGGGTLTIAGFDWAALGFVPGDDRRPDGERPDLRRRGHARSTATRTSRSPTARPLAQQHARDADTIVGDNGRIVRIVGTNNTDLAPSTGDRPALRPLRLRQLLVRRRLRRERQDRRPRRPPARLHARRARLQARPCSSRRAPRARSAARPPTTRRASAARRCRRAREHLDDDRPGRPDREPLHRHRRRATRSTASRATTPSTPAAATTCIYGDAQDDDLIGGWGGDWISGGTGQDGIIGDDGRIFTSRNTRLQQTRTAGLTTSRPSRCYGDPRLPSASIRTPRSSTATCSTSSSTRRARCRRRRSTSSSQLKKEVDITPYNLGPNDQAGHFQIDVADLRREQLRRRHLRRLGRRLPARRLGRRRDRRRRGAAELLRPALHRRGRRRTARPHRLDAAAEPGQPAPLRRRLRPVARAEAVRAAARRVLPLRRVRPAPRGALRRRRRDVGLHAVLEQRPHVHSRARRSPAFPYQFFLNLVESSKLVSGTTVLITEGRETASSCVNTAPNGTCLLLATVNTDGNDLMFGDLGNDWLVGGSGKDDIYGGWGNDLMNADDILTTNGSLNDTTDTHGTYEDRAYGGAGIDILIGNTGGDRLIDWVGEWNSYIVPFSPFGIDTVSRQVHPFLPEFLYALSASDGADPTRDFDTGSQRHAPGPERRVRGRARPDHPAGSPVLAAADRRAERPAAREHPRRLARREGRRRLQQRQAAGLRGRQRLVGGLDGLAEGRRRRRSARTRPRSSTPTTYLPVYFEIQALDADAEAARRLEGERVRDLRLLDADRLQVRRDRRLAEQDRDGPPRRERLARGRPGAGAGQPQGGHLLHAARRRERHDRDGRRSTAAPPSRTPSRRGSLERRAGRAEQGLHRRSAPTTRAASSTTSSCRCCRSRSRSTGPRRSRAAPGCFSGEQSGSWAVTGGRYGSVAPAGTTSVSTVDLGRQISPASYLELSSVVNTSAVGGLVFDFYGTSDYKFVALDVAGREDPGRPCRQAPRLGRRRDLHPHARGRRRPHAPGHHQRHVAQRQRQRHLRRQLRLQLAGRRRRGWASSRAAARRRRTTSASGRTTPASRRRSRP